MGGNTGKRSLAAGPFLLIAGLMFMCAAGAASPGGNPFMRPASPLDSGQENEPPSDMSPRYDLYVTFDASRECVPEDGPYLTQLRYGLHVPRLRFIFRSRTLDGMPVNWYPHHGEGNESAFPVLTFMSPASVDCRLCPHIKCDKEIKKAWFTNQNKSCMAVLTVVTPGEISDISGEILDMEKPKALNETIVWPERYVLHVKIVAHDNFTWTGECTVRHQDAGSAGGLGFYLGLPSMDLRLGREVSKEFPFRCDSIDAEGVLTVRFILHNPKK